MFFGFPHTYCHGFVVLWEINRAVHLAAKLLLTAPRGNCLNEKLLRQPYRPLRRATNARRQESRLFRRRLVGLPLHSAAPLSVLCDRPCRTVSSLVLRCLPSRLKCLPDCLPQTRNAMPGPKFAACPPSRSPWHRCRSASPSSARCLPTHKQGLPIPPAQPTSRRPSLALQSAAKVTEGQGQQDALDAAPPAPAQSCRPSSARRPTIYRSSWLVMPTRQHRHRRRHRTGRPHLPPSRNPADRAWRPRIPAPAVRGHRPNCATIRRNDAGTECQGG